MSVLTMLNEAVTQAPFDAIAAPGGNGDGVFDWLQVKSREAVTVIRSLGVVFVSGAVLFAILRFKSQVAAILVAIAIGAGALYGLWNMTELRDRVDNEVNTISKLDEALQAGGPILASLHYPTWD